jgi:NAD+ kinase
MKIALHGRQITEDKKNIVQTIFDELHSNGNDVMVSSMFSEFLNEAGIKTKNISQYSSKSHLKEVDFIFSIGGDGTLLETLTHVGKLQIPILGINTGRLGFLATTTKFQIKDMLEPLISDNYIIDERTLIRLNSDSNIFGENNFALNEFTILKKDTSSMIVVHTYIDDLYLFSEW